MLQTEAQADLNRLRGALVVSCQAREGSPLHGPVVMAAMAKSALLGGAVGIRANGEADVAAIRAAVGPDVPIAGISKVSQTDGSLFITPTAQAARTVLAAGARLVALDGTTRPRPGGESLADVVAAIHDGGGAALADVGTTEHARYALACGVDAIGTTLSGYTPDSPKQDGPDFVLLESLVSLCPIPVFAEGRIWTGEEARRALDLGAAFVVVGTAITNPTAITTRFVAVMRGAATARGHPAPRTGERAAKSVRDQEDRPAS